jgi:hypothetical protein
LKEAFLKNGEVFAGRPSLYITDKATRNLGTYKLRSQSCQDHFFFLSKFVLKSTIHRGPTI